MTAPAALPIDPAAPPGRTWVEIDLAALRHNCQAAQACCPSPAKSLIAVVKADAYGFGMLPVAHALADLVRAFAVANLAEARALRADGIALPIYLLSPALPHEQQAIADDGFCPPISQQSEVARFAAAAAHRSSPLPVHLVVDTGMGRIGALPHEAPALLQSILSCPQLALDSIASHFPSADEDPLATRLQADRLTLLIDRLRAQGFPLPPTHLANSAALSTRPTLGGDWTRVGLMLYGVAPRPSAQADLLTVLTWKTRVALVRALPPGHGISYGSAFVTARPTTLVTLPVGYADGFPRQASGQGAAVLLGGQPCPVLGRVTMDQIMVDATDLPTPPEVGDEAVLIGSQGSQEITAAALAAAGGTIAWDLFTGLGARVERRYSSRMF